jgi:hypothetical protein
MSSKKTTLHLAPNLRLPLDFVTKTAAILAQRRKGKTYTASVLAEEMVAAQQPFVALDPTGAWWGLRASADGEGPGLPVVVLGGQHGDVPLERTGGRLVADLVVDAPGYYVIDFSLFESGEAERQFAVDFAERLYRAKGQPGKDFPLHLFVDEADRFIPQQMRKGSNETSPRLLGAFEAIVRRGGLRGLGTTLISQRAAVVNKNVLEMLDVLITLRTVGPNDQHAILDYVKAHGDETVRKEMMGSLAGLEIGEAWVWEPGAEPPLFERVRIRARRTFNSSATPKPGETRVEPKRLADVDLAALQKRMAATIEKAKADDPGLLRREIVALKNRVASLSAPPKGLVGPNEIERIRVEEYAGGRARERQEIAKKIRSVVGTFDTLRLSLATTLERLEDLASQVEAERVVVGVDRAKPGADRSVAVLARRHDGGKVEVIRSFELSARGNGTVPKGERKILAAAASYPEDGVARDQLSVLTGYKKSSRDTYVQRLAANGLLEIGADGQIRATAAGVTALGPDFAPLPTGDLLRAYWLDRLPEGERKVLEVVLAGYPNAVGRDEISEATEYKKSSRDTYIQRLGARRLITTERQGVCASSTLFT